MQLNLKFADEEVNQYHMGVEQLQDLEEIKRENDSTIITTKLIDHYVSKALEDSIRHHMVILLMCKKMDELFRLYLLVILFQIISITCFLAYLVNVVSFHLWYLFEILHDTTKLKHSTLHKVKGLKTVEHFGVFITGPIRTTDVFLFCWDIEIPGEWLSFSLKWISVYIWIILIEQPSWKRFAAFILVFIWDESEEDNAYHPHPYNETCLVDRPEDVHNGC